MDLVTALAIIERAQRDPAWAQKHPLAYQRAITAINRHTDDAVHRADDPNAIEAW